MGNGDNDDSSKRAAVNTIRCMAKPCEQVRKSGNHWFVVWTDDPRGIWHCVAYSPGMLAAVGEDQARTVCGSGCAQIMFQRYLAGEEI
jgi:hypothetical protein